MNNVKIITYVLSKPERDHEDLIKAIKDYETCAKITEFTWIDELLSIQNSCVKMTIWRI
ncbi:hypothetical protein [Bacillus cereus]|uniref:hypothetical protein n=1 Tax=Bacillus cereus TaxID=1396 RepID=UPI001483B579|nr:hypothetical protein [Bacillus cereus]